MQDQTTGSRKGRAAGKGHEADVDLIAVVAAMAEGEPSVLTIGLANALRAGPCELGHRFPQLGLRAWVEHHAASRPCQLRQWFRPLRRSAPSRRQ